MGLLCEGCKGDARTIIKEMMMMGAPADYEADVRVVSLRARPGYAAVGKFSPETPCYAVPCNAKPCHTIPCLPVFSLESLDQNRTEFSLIRHASCLVPFTTHEPPEPSDIGAESGDASRGGGDSMRVFLASRSASSASMRLRLSFSS